MKEKKTNKTEKVLEHLQKYGYITSLEAIELYGATRLSDIIFRLRKRNYNISTIDMPFCMYSLSYFSPFKIIVLSFT